MLPIMNFCAKIHRITASIRIVRPLSSFNVIYNSHGDPAKVLEGQHKELPVLSDGEILIKFLASTINPADINQIQGVYPIKPPLPAIGGNEGVAEVMESKSSKFKNGNWVISAKAGFGTWRSYAICKETELIPIDNSIPLECAATLAVNPCTAYRMLKDFENVQSGDFVLQNGANSAVGQAVIQIAADMGIKTVNVIRDRENFHETMTDLKELGADYVIAESETKTQLKKIFTSAAANKQEAKLALNCVGSNSATNLLRFLQPKCTMVTYGCMSKVPFKAGAGSLIFNDVRLRGFWMTRWNDENSTSQKRYDMIDYIVALIKNNKLRPPHVERIPLQSFSKAIQLSMTEYTSRKVLLVSNC